MLSTTSSSAVKLEFLCDFSSVIAVKSITIAVNPSGMFSMSDIYIAIKLQKQLTRNRFRKLKIAHEFLDWSCMSTSIGKIQFYARSVNILQNFDSLFTDSAGSVTLIRFHRKVTGTKELSHFTNEIANAFCVHERTVQYIDWFFFVCAHQRGSRKYLFTVEWQRKLLNLNDVIGIFMKRYEYKITVLLLTLVLFGKKTSGKTLRCNTFTPGLMKLLWKKLLCAQIWKVRSLKVRKIESGKTSISVKCLRFWGW